MNIVGGGTIQEGLLFCAETLMKTSDKRAETTCDGF